MGHEAERENLLAFEVKGDYESEMIAAHVEDGDDAFAFHSHKVGGRIEFANFVDITPCAASDGRPPKHQPCSSRGVRFGRSFQEFLLDDSHDDILSSFLHSVKERLEK